MIPDVANRADLEQLYIQLLSLVVLLARVLGKPCPIVTRDERRQMRKELTTGV